MSRADKQTTRVYYDITVDHNSGLATRIDMRMTTQVRKDGQKPTERIIFDFEYELQKFDEVARFDIPKEIHKLLK